MAVRDLKIFIEQTDQLPTLAPVAVHLMEGAWADGLKLNSLVELLSADPALTANILRIANSPELSLRKRISSVEEAVSILGTEHLQSLILASQIFDIFSPQIPGEFDWIAFWRHCLGCALVSEKLAIRFQYPNPKEAYTAGLLHDLGKLIFLHWDRTRYEKTIFQARRLASRLLEAEESELQMGHTQAAKLLLESWRVPAPLVMSAWLHHQPLSQLGSNPLERLPFVVKCANSLCQLWRIGDSGDSIIDLDQEQLEQMTGFSTSEIESLAGSVNQQVVSRLSHFDQTVSRPRDYFALVQKSNRRISKLLIGHSMRHREAEFRERVLNAIRQLLEARPASSTPGRVIEDIVNLLAKTIGYRKIFIFAPLIREGVIEGRLKRVGRDSVDSLLLPVPTEAPDAFREIHSREQFAILERALRRRSEEEPAGIEKEILTSLDLPDLVVLSLESSGRVLGHLLIEPDGVEWNFKSLFDVLRRLVEAASLLLERALLLAAVDQRAEDLARMARRAHEVQSRLSQAERLAAVGRLAAGAAHEIKNPLAIISAWAQVLAGQAEGEKEREALQRIVDQSSRISKIVSDLIGFARPSEPHFSTLSIFDVLENTLTLLENRLKVSGVEVRRDFPDQLPQIRADSKQLEQVFLNIISNALHAMDEDGVLTLRCSFLPEQKRLKIEVVDNGVGIPPQELPLIFDPFYTTKKVGEGTGLGLSISHSIISNHDGEILVNSRVGEGTTFTIFLPAELSEAEAPSAPAESAETQDRKPDAQGGGSILIIDDESALRAVLSEFLSRQGFSVDDAEDGDKGMQKLANRKFDVVLLDLKMPGRSGMEVLSWTRRERPNLPVVIISALADDHQFEAAHQLGAFACIRKPFQLREILEVVQRAIGGEEIEAP